MDFEERLITELQKLNKTQKDISNNLLFYNQDEIRKCLSSVFLNDIDRKVYDLSDGKRTTKDIEKLTEYNSMKISRLWTKWSDLGIVETEGYRNPYKAICNDVEIAIKVNSSIEEISQGEENVDN